MPGAAIEISDLSKSYRLGATGEQMLRDVVAGGFQDITRRITGRRGDAPVKSKEFWALKDVSFEVNHGEAIGIIGGNGAGKSTLLKILSRITAPTAGRARIRGRVGSLLEVGTGFHPELTGRENIFLNGTILGMRRSEIRAKMDAIVDFSGVEQFLDTPVKRYSSGMYVRLAFAVAAHLEPEILIIDEVLAVGDAAFQQKCLGKMKDAAGHGRTVLFVSHNMTAVRTLCSRAVYLDHGKVVATGEIQSVIHSYLEANVHQRSEAVMDLEHWHNRYGNGQARIVHAQLVDERGQTASVLRRTEPMAVEYRIRSRSGAKLVFSAVCQTTDGTRVLHVVQHDTPGMEPTVLNGDATVRFRIPSFPLFAGDYCWILGIHTAAQEPVDVVRDVLPFKAIDVAHSTRPWESTQSSGFVTCPVTWSVQQD